MVTARSRPHAPGRSRPVTTSAPDRRPPGRRTGCARRARPGPGSTPRRPPAPGCGRSPGAAPRPAGRSRRAHDADLAAEADLAAHGHAAGRATSRAARPRPGPGRGRRRARPPGPHPRPALSTSRPEHLHVGPLLEHGEHQSQAATVDALRRPAGRCRPSPATPGPAARPAAADGRRARGRRPSRPPRAGGRPGSSPLASGTADQAALAHLEQAELVGGAVAVLHRPQQAQGVVAVALEAEHGVDEVLELAGPGEGAVLGDVADQHDGARRAPGRLGQAVGARRGPGSPSRARASCGAAVHRLDRVDHDHVGPDLERCGPPTASSVVSAGQPQLVVQGAQALGPGLDLAGRPPRR